MNNALSRIIMKHGVLKAVCRDASSADAFHTLALPSVL